MTKPIIAGPYRTFRRLNPYESYLEYEGSVITIPMKAKVKNGPWLEDEIKLNAFMRLEIYPAYVNKLGTREFQFIIRDWDLYGTSPMLNQLFFADPRGKLVERKDRADYVPAVVTFRVSNNFNVEVEGKSLSACDLFGSLGKLEFRNLTSHVFRHWTRLQVRDGAWDYTNPEPRIHFQILSGVATKQLVDDYLAKNKDKRIQRLLTAGQPAILFHNKPAGEGEFNIESPEDQINHLIAIQVLTPPQKGQPLQIRATAPDVGFSGNYAKLNGNTVISSLVRPQERVEVRWAFSDRISSLQDLDALLVKASGAGRGHVGGVIRIVNPARSLGTSDQAPDVGHPIDSADFPARITYAINYDIFMNCERFVEDQAGIAIAVGTLEIPPRDVTVAFDKPHLGYVLEQFLEFGAGHCTGMHEITPAEYAAGLHFARYWRKVPLKADAKWDDDQVFQPYDPDGDY